MRRRRRRWRGRGPSHPARPLHRAAPGPPPPFHGGGIARRSPYSSPVKRATGFTNLGGVLPGLPSPLWRGAGGEGRDVLPSCGFRSQGHLARSSRPSPLTPLHKGEGRWPASRLSRCVNTVGETGEGDHPKGGGGGEAAATEEHCPRARTDPRRRGPALANPGGVGRRAGGACGWRHGRARGGSPCGDRGRR